MSNESLNCAPRFGSFAIVPVAHHHCYLRLLDPHCAGPIPLKRPRGIHIEVEIPTGLDVNRFSVSMGRAVPSPSCRSSMGENYPASVTAVDNATLLFVSKQDFQALCLAHPQVALKVLRVVGARLRRLVGIIEELSFTTVRHRLASFLLRLAQTEGKRTADGVEVTLPISNQELASQIGTVRELVSRNLFRFQSEGLVRIDGRSVIIHDLKALEAELRSAE